MIKIRLFTFIIIITNSMPRLIRKYTRKLLLPVKLRGVTYEQSLYFKEKMQYILNSKKHILTCAYKNYCEMLKQHHNKPVKYSEFHKYFIRSKNFNELMGIWKDSGYVSYQRPVICIMNKSAKRDINNMIFKITGTPPRRASNSQSYERKAVYNNPLEILEQLRVARENNIPILEFEGVKVKTSSLRYRTFELNTQCVSCGLKGEFMALEKPKFQDCKTWHFNLYGHDEYGNEVMLTKDHIMPKAKGGKDRLENMQTMCAYCNSVKGDKITEKNDTKEEKHELCVA